MVRPMLIFVVAALVTGVVAAVLPEGAVRDADLLVCSLSVALCILFAFFAVAERVSPSDRRPRGPTSIG